MYVVSSSLQFPPLIAKPPNKQDLCALVLPPLLPAVRVLLSSATVVSNLNARVAALFGVWRPVVEVSASKAD